MSTRALSGEERDLLERLLSVSDAEVAVLRKQLPHTRVEAGTSLQSQTMLDLVVDTSACAASAVPYRVPVEGDGFDSEGPFELLLFVSDDGYLAGLEGYRSMGRGPIGSIPRAQSIRIRLFRP